ncbi:MAG: DegT/DnrJ/EryC1/StrS family aminotransferase [Methanoregula sp.]|nr:DegT/DnrJ/EryC1/StrS family aminotransferase [Methanoregula sp.]
MKEIPLTKPYFDNDEIKEIKDVLDSGWVTQGPKVKEFEEGVARKIRSKHAIAVTNCTAALHLALLCSGVSSGDEVLVADYTFPATGHAVLYCGAKPIFVDIDPDSYNINPEKIEALITDRTRAIIPVHTFGQPARMDEILKIARNHSLSVIEDAACALGAQYKGKYAGAIGDIGCFSFHARKGITTGEGGMLVTNNDEIAAKARHLSMFGMKSAWEREGKARFSVPEFIDVGYNYKMSDITAAVGVAQLRRLDQIIDRKRTLAQHWDTRLDEIEGIDKPYIDPDTISIYQSYVALLNPTIDRNKMIQDLLSRGIQTQIGTYASHMQPVYHAPQTCPCSQDVFHRAISLPMYFTLQETVIDEVAETIQQTIGGYK